MTEDELWEKESDELSNHFPPRIFPREKDSQLAEALYSMCERQSWNMELDLDSIDVESALRIHAVVETVKQHGFPDKFRM